MRIPLLEDEDKILYRHPSPREEWTQAGPEERESLEKYEMFMEPDILLCTTSVDHPEISSI